MKPFFQEYSAYCKKKWCPAGGKDPLFGRVDGFQIDPKYPDYELRDSARTAPQSHYGQT